MFKCQEELRLNISVVFSLDRHMIADSVSINVQFAFTVPHPIQLATVVVKIKLNVFVVI